jgi:hypothetical protein
MRVLSARLMAGVTKVRSRKTAGALQQRPSARGFAAAFARRIQERICAMAMEIPTTAVKPGAYANFDKGVAAQKRQANVIPPSGGGVLDQRTRAVLAVGLVLVGVLVIVLFGVLDARVAGKTDGADKVFTSVVGLVGAWVSTILVFYFSRENFQAAEKAVNQAISTGLQVAQAGSAAAGSTVGAAMTPLERVRSIDLDAEPTVLVKRDLCSKLDELTTRIPVTVGGVAKYVIHDASIFRFIADRALHKHPQPIEQATLEDFLTYKFEQGENSGHTVKDIVGRFVTLPVSATLVDARAELLKSRGCQDVVCTQNGRPTEKMLGLLTNDDIAKIVEG